MLRGPLARSATVTGRQNPGVSQVVGILLALDDEHGLIGFSHQFRQPVRYCSHALDGPFPSSALFGPPLPEALGLTAYNLEEQNAIFVLVVVIGNVLDVAAGRLACAMTP